MCSRPVARLNDDGRTLEVIRLCTDGTRKACSILYGASARIAKTMGYKKIITYILKSENGISLKASGFSVDGTTRGRSWDTPSRRRTDKSPTEDKVRYAKIL